MRKAVFLDRDGTINEEKQYLCRIEDFTFLPGVPDALEMLQRAGYLLVVVTNQSGIARGFYTEVEARRLNDWMMRELQKKKIHISKVYYCPHHPEAKIEAYRKVCTCRKPGLGLFEQAVREFSIDLAGSYAVGDKLRDCAICRTTSCRGFLIGDNEQPAIIEKVKNHAYPRLQYANDLLACARVICGKGGEIRKGSVCR